MAKINNIIPVSNYELIRDRIALILGIELANQFVLNGEDFAPDVYLERTNPFDKTELPAVNVSLASGNYDNKNQGDSRNTVQFHIDVYTSSPSTNSIKGDKQSMFNCQRLIGICRAILENPVYKTLDFEPPSISRSSCDSFGFGKPAENDAQNITQGRIIFSVVCHETTELKTAVQIGSWYTQVKLSDTDKGYMYEGKNLADFNRDFNNDYNIAHTV